MTTTDKVEIVHQGHGFEIELRYPYDPSHPEIDPDISDYAIKYVRPATGEEKRYGADMSYWLENIPGGLKILDDMRDLAILALDCKYGGL